MPDDAIQPQSDSPGRATRTLAVVLELVRAGRLVVDEWGDGDGVDPDRMDVVVARLEAAVADLER